MFVLRLMSSIAQTVVCEELNYDTDVHIQKWGILTKVYLQSKP